MKTLLLSISIIALVTFSCISPSSKSSNPENNSAKSSEIKKAFSFNQCTRGEIALPLNDGDYIIAGYTLDKMIIEHDTDVVFDKRRGMILRVDSNLEKKWVYINDRDFNNEISSIIKTSDTTLACFYVNYDKKKKTLNTMTMLTINMEGKLTGEKQVKMTDYNQYTNDGAVLAADGSIILFGQCNTHEPKTDYHFAIHKINLKGKILKERIIKIPNELAIESHLISSPDSTLYFAGATMNFKSIKLMKMNTKFETIWEQTILNGFNPKLKSISSDEFIFAYKKNDKDLASSQLILINKEGKTIWQTKKDGYLPSYITKEQNGNFSMLSLTLSSATGTSVMVSNISEKGVITTKKIIDIDSVLHTSYMDIRKDGKIFVIGQEQGQNDEYDRKMILLYKK
jgi:hypothetical protein